MNKGNERLMAILEALRKMPRWVLILITLGVIVLLGVAMFFLLPESKSQQGENAYINSTGLAFEVFLKLVVVVVLIIAVAIILRRLQSKNHIVNSRQINVLETVHLSPHRTLYLIKMADHHLLIGATDQNLTNLFQLKITEEEGNTSLVNQTENFSEFYNRAKSSLDHFENKPS